MHRKRNFSKGIKMRRYHSTVFKKGDRKIKSNYRPISLLPLISKIFEKAIQEQLVIISDKFLSPKLCGFRTKHSTQHALLDLIRNLKNWLDRVLPE